MSSSSIRNLEYNNIPPSRWRGTFDQASKTRTWPMDLLNSGTQKPLKSEATYTTKPDQCDFSSLASVRLKKRSCLTRLDQTRLDQTRPYRRTNLSISSSRSYCISYTYMASRLGGQRPMKHESSYHNSSRKLSWTIDYCCTSYHSLCSTVQQKVLDSYVPTQ